MALPRLWHSKRSISQVVGLTILIAVVIILASFVGAFFFGFEEDIDDPPPTVDITASFNVTDQADPHWQFTISHNSGGTVAADDLQIRLTDDRGGTATVRYPESFTAGTTVSVGLWGSPSRVTPSSCLVAPSAAPGAGDNQLAGTGSSEYATEVDVVVVHKPSNTLLSQVTVDLTDTDRGWTGDNRHYIADGSTASINCESVPRDDW
jgi:FlaG/FlaF family flagellin (archaellin)